MKKISDSCFRNFLPNLSGVYRKTIPGEEMFVKTFVTIFLVIFMGSTALSQSRILLLETMSVTVVVDSSKAFKKKLSQSGLDYVLDEYNGEGSVEKLSDFLKEYLANSPRPHAVVTNATLASKAAFELLQKEKIPQVFLTVTNPVAAGLIPAGVSHSAGHITGRPFGVPHAAKLQIFNRLLGDRKYEIGIVHCNYPASIANLEKLRTITDQQRNLNIHVRTVEFTQDPKVMINDALAAARELGPHVDYFWVSLGPLSEWEEFTSGVAAIRPIVYGSNLISVEQGALFGLVPNEEAMGIEAADLVLKIIKGADPGSLVIETPKEMTFSINLNTAQKLKVVVPSDLLQFAGSNIIR